MKKLIPFILLTLTGCAYHRTTETTIDLETNAKDQTTFTGIVWFNRTAVSGLTVGKRTGKETTTLSIDKAATETQAEAIAAIAEAAVKGAVKGAVPLP